MSFSFFNMAQRLRVATLMFMAMALALAIAFLAPTATLASDRKEVIVVKLHTNQGDITLKLNAAKAPETVANFMQYVNDGHYDNTVFHRVIPGFMIQGGGFTPEMTQKDTRDSINNEASNGLKNKTGSIAMARTSDPHSATAQFFINVADNTFLDFTSPAGNGWGYCVFGEVTDGMDVVKAIESERTGNSGMHQNVPMEPIIIERAEAL